MNEPAIEAIRPRLTSQAFIFPVGSVVVASHDLYALLEALADRDRQLKEAVELLRGLFNGRAGNERWVGSPLEAEVRAFLLEER